MDEIHPLYFVRLPANWPDPPERFSFSLLNQIEHCPRQWALSHASYPDIWDKPGYPERPVLPAIKGRITHSVVDRVTRLFIAEGCESFSDPKAIEILHANGGYTGLIREAMNQVITDYHENPRAQHLMNDLTLFADRAFSEIKSNVQTLLIQGFKNVVSQKRMHSTHTSGQSTALRPGAYSEIILKNSEKNWIGRIDRLNVSESECEIQDYKTGSEQEKDAFQMQLYTWLWNSDYKRNPNRIPVTKLSLLYPTGRVNIPPQSDQEIVSFDERLHSRTQQAIASVSGNLPAAQPAVEKCRHCNVRHMCNEYWLHDEAEIIPNAMKSNYFDVQLKLGNRRGPKTWNVIVDKCVPSFVSNGNTILISSNQFLNQLEITDKRDLRLIGVTISEQNNESNAQNGPLLVATKHTEVFLIE